ncbi:amino acid adenylation domain-containing protein [Actinomadura sp. 9N215]|uniref:amino acid adenylation domain-containing protein n=1 Tax=Actinomadura sp. 9N215 TaxID=3375150 RepID=UPI0037B64F6B
METTEIETTLTTHPNIQTATVIPHRDRLVAYVVAFRPLGANELRDHLKARLPQHMIPAAYVFLDAIPLTTSGKVNRYALPDPGRTRPELTDAYRPPRTPTERTIAAIWAEVLGLDRVGIHDNFFELGGHSILATKVVARIRSDLRTGPLLADLFDSPTVAGLASAIDDSVGTEPPPPLVRADRDQRLELSFAQQRLWFLNRLSPDGAEYNVPIALQLTGDLDVDALRQALDELVTRHEILRTTVSTTADGTPIQHIDEAHRVRLLVSDLSEQSSDHALAEARRLVGSDATAPFDLRRDAPFRAHLIRVGEGDHVLSMTLHHIAADHASAAVLHDELSVLYSAFRQGLPCPLAPPTIQYADFAAWQRQWLRGDVLRRQVDYWRAQLTDLPVLELPTDGPRPAHRDPAGALYQFSVPAEVSNKLRELSREAGCTTFMTLLAAFQVLLSRHSGQDDIAVGSPIAGRAQPETERLIGFFVNTLVFRGDLAGDPTFRELLGRVRRTALDAYAHQDLPFEHLVEVLRPERGRGRHPLFDVFFSYRTRGDLPVQADLGGVSACGLPIDHVTSQFDLTLNVTDDQHAVHAALEYSVRLFDPVTIERLASHLLNILEAITAEPEVRLSRIAMVPDTERAELAAWSTGPPAPSPVRPLHLAISDQAALTPDHVAVVAADQQLTYEELNQDAEQLARHLVTLGVGPESVIAICLPRSPLHVTAMLAVWKAGATHLVLDPGNPLASTAYQLTDSAAAVLITATELLDGLPEHPIPLVLVDDRADLDALPAVEEAEAHRLGPHLDNAAYLTYTSGSTGAPKAVTVTHRSLAAYVQHITRRLDLRGGAGYATLQSLSVDFAVTMLYPALAQGGTVHLLPPDIDSDRLWAHLRDQRIDYIKLLPTQLAALTADGGAPAADLPVTALVLGGEPLPGPLLSGLEGVSVHNHYGPSETTVGVTTHPAESGSSSGDVPIGTPLANISALVLDENLRPVPVGVPGELFIGGVQVARGYHGRAALTAERFVADPHGGEGSRIYRTGDRVRWNREGLLEFLGRADDQVKIRGHRVEPGEIERALVAHAAVQAAAVVPRGDVPSETRLFGYLVPAADTLPDVSELRAFLRARLPDHMIPAGFLSLDRLPQTSSGKLDRKALPAPDGDRPTLAAAFIAPATGTEQLLADIWRQVLRIDRIGAHDDFFDLGGHSILATQVVSRIRVRFHVDLPVAAVFDAPTLAGLAATIDTAARSQPPPPIAPIDGNGPLTLSFAQQRLWFLNRLEPDSPEYNIPSALRLTGELDTAALQRALDEIAARHRVLRTTIATAADGTTSQHVHAPAPVELTSVDLSGLPADQAEDRARRVLDEVSAAPFDLAVDPPLRTTLIRIGQDEHVLGFTLHHIASDDWSTGIFARELSALYSAFRSGEPSPLPPLEVQYADYAAWQREVLAGGALEDQLGYWSTQLAGLPAMDLPTDRPRPPVRNSAGALHTFAVPVTTVGGLQRLSREHGCSMFMTLLAAYQVLLNRHTGQLDLAIGSPITGRTHPDTEQLIGFFVNTLVLRADASGDPPFTELLARTRKVALDAYAHQDVPFEHLVDALQPVRDRGRHPLFDVMFSYAAGHDDFPGLADIDACGFPIGHTTSKFDLTLNLAENDGTLRAAFEYSTDLFDLETMEQLASRLITILRSVVDDPGVRLSEIDLLDESEREQLARWSSGPQRPRPDRLLHESIAAQAARFPDSVAVVADERWSTYQALDQAANRLAHHLRDLGAGPETVVAVGLPRGVELVTTVLAIWKSGAAYLPLDPGDPPERLAYQLDDAAAGHLVTTNELRGSFSASASDARRTVVLDDPVTAAALDKRPTRSPSGHARPDTAAYLIYTSGSTGTPKAVVTAHESLANRVHWQLEAHGFGPGDRVLQRTAPTFDVSLWELCGPLVAGGTVVIAPHDADRDPGALARAVHRHSITAVDLVPALLGPFLDAADPRWTTRLRLITCGGEPLPRSLVRRCHDRLGAHVEVRNLYGPTEASIDVTDAVCLPDAPHDPDIGTPHANTACHVLDASLNPVPTGVAGELYIAGTALARGYHGRPDLTAERFVANPVGADGTRIYRTGDRARRRRDGHLEFLGRLDAQVKIRGHRVEPGEVEAALADHPGVGTAVVTAPKDAAGTLRLTAYIVPTDSDRAADIGELRDFLRERLTEPMIPAVFVIITDPPLTSSGKIDRKELPAPGTGRPGLSTAFVPPRTTTEQVLADIWQSVLHIDRVGVHDDFFESGGDSILSLRIVARAAAAGVVITPAQMFDHPTVAGLAVVAGTDTRVQAEQERVTGPVGLLPIHRWWAEQRLRHPHHFNQATWVQAPLRLDADVLERAAVALSDHHDALRLRARGYPDDLRLTVAARDEPLVTLHHGPDVAGRLAAIAETAQAGLDLESGPIWRVELVDQGPDRGSRLLIVVHHLAIDTVSWRILIDDLSRAYTQLARGESADLGPKTVSIRQWAERTAGQGQRTQPVAVGTPVESDPLPIDHTTGPATEAHAETHGICLDADATQALIREAHAAYRTRINDLLLAALSHALHAWAGIRRPLVEVEGHGRTDALDLSRTIGWFTGLTPVVLDADLDEPADLIKGVKERLRTPRHDDLLGSPEIGFNYHGRIDAPGHGGGGAAWRPTAGPTGWSRHPDTPLPHLLEVTGTVTDGRLNIYLTYPSTRYRADTIRALGDRLHDALALVIEHTTRVAQTAPGAATPSDFPLAGLSQEQVDRLVDTAGFPIEDVYPLSPMQQGMLLHTLLDPASGAYFEQTVLTFDGPLDTELLQAAFQHLVDWHPILRTAVRHHDQTTPLQLVAAHADVPWAVQDWTRSPAGEHDARLTEFLAADRARGLDLARPPLLRLTLIRHSADRHTLVLAEHHLLLDGWSQPVLLDDLRAAYGALASGEAPMPPTRRPYRDYIAWLGDQDRQRDLEFWAGQLAGFTGPTPLADEPTGSAPEHARHHWHLSEDTTQRLSELARTRQLTLNTILRGALALLIAHRTGSSDVCYGATVAGRPDALPGAENMLGLFINTVPVRAQLSAQQTILDLLNAVQHQQLQQQPHQHTSLVDIQAASILPADAPLFDTILIFENYPVPADGAASPTPTLNICDSTTLEHDHYPLTLVTGPGAPLRLTFSYDRARHTETAVRRMADHLTALLEAMAGDPGRELSELPLVSTDEETCLRQWGRGHSESASEYLVPDLIAMQAAATPDATAVVAGQARVSYSDLDEQANRLAHHLRALGIGPESVVAVFLHRSPDLITSLLAIWKAGAAYLPLDPDGPRDRLGFQLEDGRTSMIITTTELGDRLPEHDARVLPVDDHGIRDALARHPGSPPEARGHADHTAYLMYTSGSTGAPKAVTGTHRGLANRLLWQVKAHRYTSGDRVLHKNPISFDASLWELCCPLLAGAAIVMAPPGAHRDPVALSHLIERHDVTVVQFVASLLAPFLEAVGDERCTSLRLVLCSGEPIPGTLARRWYDLLHRRAMLRIGYGPTEASIGVTDEFLEAAPRPDRIGPIGVPVANTTAYVLDERLRLVPVGTPGELYVGGPQLARCYHRRPALTAQRFVPDPQAGDGSRLYRTGDRVRWLPDGRLEFLGRTDDQVKILGQRVEPAEVETALSTHPGVRSVTVTARREPDEEPRLAAYIVAANPEAPPADGELRSFLRARLPAPMIPETFTFLGELPVTDSGKVDKRALPAPHAGRGGHGEPVPPSTETEKTLARIWSDVLKIEQPGAHDDFFELGGNSLHAFRISAQAHAEFGIELPIAAVFETPTLAGLANTMDVLRWTRDPGPDAPETEGIEL